MSFLQLVLNGLALGASYALVSLGFVFIVNATGAVNFAQGDLVMAGGYVAIAVASLFSVAVPAAPASRCTGHFRARHRRLADRLFPADTTTPRNGIYQHAALRNDSAEPFLVLFGPEARSGPALIGTGMLHFGGLELSRQAAGTIVVAAVIIAVQYLLFAKTQFGRRLRATAEDREMAEAIGIPAKILIAITFGLGTSLAGIAGALLANQYFVYPTGGIPSAFSPISQWLSVVGKPCRCRAGLASHLGVPSGGFGLRVLCGGDRGSLCDAAADLLAASARHLRERVQRRA